MCRSLQFVHVYYNILKNKGKPLAFTIHQVYIVGNL